jgi:type IV pilus assembly protein PilM
MKKDTPYFYHDRPLFGLDIGLGNLKVMQIEPATHSHKSVVTGYGTTSFATDAIKDGVIVNHEAIAQAAHELFAKNLVGEITTRRVAVAIPASRTFNRTLVLPKMKKRDIADAVRLEAEQYIPVPIDQLYLDYSVISEGEHGTELLAVAVPKKIIDSYMQLTRILGLEPIAMETTISASCRLFVQAERNEVPTVLIDLGSVSSDITIYDNTLVVTGTVPGGGDNFNQQIAQHLGVTPEEAHIIKTKYGLGYSKKQKEVTDSLRPILSQLAKEVRRMIRYYEERGQANRKIGQVVTLGGGANMPGLSAYLTDELRLPVRMCDTWQHLKFGGLQPPNASEKSMYATAAGLAMIKPKEVFAA